MTKIELPELVCKRCGHGSGEKKWYPRKPVKPTVCPKCKSPYWDREKKSK